MEPRQLEKLRLLTLGDKQDTSQDDLLHLLTELAEARFRLYLNHASRKSGQAERFDTVPSELQWILLEVVVHRFNRIGSEGMSSESVEGHSITFSADAFDDYASIIDDFFSDPEVGKRRHGKVVVY